MEAIRDNGLDELLALYGDAVAARLAMSMCVATVVERPGEKMMLIEGLCECAIMTF